MTNFTGKTDSELARNITTDSFFPTLSVGDFQRNYRVPAEYAIHMVENDLRLAAERINSELLEQQLAWVLAGHSDLAAAEAADSRSLKSWYLHAVYCRAKATLLRQFSTVSKRAAANNNAKESMETEGHFLALSNRAVRQIKNLGNITAELL